MLKSGYKIFRYFFLNKGDENFIMDGGIAGEEVIKFGQNLKSFSE